MRDATFTIGSIRYHVVSDGRSAYRPADLFRDVSLDALTEAVGDALTDDGLLVTPYHCGLIETSDGMVLLDAGMGPIAAEIGAPAGLLVDSLRSLGIEPEDVDVVVISHAHLDHIGGLVRNGTVRFPRARHLLAGDEWDFWMSDECERRLSGEMADLLIGGARGHLPKLREAGLLELVEGETTVAPGVTMVPAPGHTPGHTVVAVSAREDSCLYLADAFLHEAHLPHSDWVSAVDVDPELTVATRIGWFERAASDRSIVTAFHVGTAGRIQRTDGAYRFADEA